MGRLRDLAGLLFIGYGLLVVLRIVAHEALIAGITSLALGILLLIRNMPLLPTSRLPRAWLVAGLGGTIVIGLVTYNLALQSGLGGPEWGLLIYGVALLSMAILMGSGRGGVRASALVGWSFPLVLAPLILWTIHAILSGPAGLTTGQLAAPLIHAGLVLPAAWGLEWVGTPTRVLGDNLLLATPRGNMTLGVGLVCAGIYPMVLFAGILALHAWREGLSPKRTAAYLAVGLAGLWIANILRIILLAKIGQHWGAHALQTAHAHLGWIFFVGFMVLYWHQVLRRWEPNPTAPAPLPIQDARS